VNLSLRDILAEGVGHWLSKAKLIRDYIFHKPTTGRGQVMNNHNFSWNCGLYAFGAFWDALVKCQDLFIFGLTAFRAGGILLFLNLPPLILPALPSGQSFISAETKSTGMYGKKTWRML
jgi:hypothetical protein